MATTELLTLHKQLGHPCTNTTKKTAKELSIKLKGDMEDCIECSLGKIKKNAVPRISLNHSEEPGERISFDLSSSRYTSLGGKKHWILAIDQATKYKWSEFLQKKDETGQNLCKILRKLECKERSQNT